jgi:hypothetical protein
VIDLDLPDGPGSPLVRGFAACLASALESPLAKLAALGPGEPIGHALNLIAGLGAATGLIAGR